MAKKTAPVGQRAEDSRSITLGGIVDELGAGIVQLLAAPLGLDVHVTGPVLHDPDEDALHPGPGALLLAIGTRPDTRDAISLLTHAASSTAAGVVFKHAHPDSRVVQHAHDAGVAVLGIPEEMTWGQAFSLFTTVVATAHGGQAGVPVPMGDLFALANALAASVGGAVTLEDPLGKVLAYSTLEDQRIDEVRRRSIVGRQVLDTPASRTIYQRLWRTEGVIRVESVEGMKILPRLAVAVRAGNEVLGSVWAVEGKTPLTSRAEDALLEASRMAALHFLRARAAEDLGRRMRSELVRSILEGTVSVQAAAARLGLPAESDCAVVAFRLPAADEAERELQHGKLVDLILFFCETFNRQATCVVMESTVYGLLPVTNQTEAERLPRLARKIGDTAEARLAATPLVGIGSIVNLREAPRSRAEADRVLQVLASDRLDERVARIEDVQSQAILLELRDLTADSSLQRGPLRPLIEHDAANGTDLVPTLRAYLESFGDFAVAASRLSIHPNTCRYRMRQVFDLLDLSDPDTRLVLELQLRLL